VFAEFWICSTSDSLLVVLKVLVALAMVQKGSNENILSSILIYL